MKKVSIKNLLIGALLLVPSVAFSQLSNTLYFNRYNPRQHQVNPAVQPDGEFYIGMPGVSTIGLSAGNSRFVFKDIFQNVQKNGESQTILFLDKYSDGMSNFLDLLKFKERVFASYKVDLIDFGFRTQRNNYYTVSISNRMETMVIIPHQIPEAFFKGMKSGEEYDFRFKRLSASATLFSQLAVGCSRQLNSKLTVGATLKYLYGHANAYTDFYDLDMQGSEDEWYLKGDAAVHASVPGLRFVPDGNKKVKTVEFDDEQPVSAYLKPQGHGAAIDLGATYQLLPRLQLSASLIDLGFIRWGKHLSQLDKKRDLVYDGIQYDINDDSNDEYDEYLDQLEDMYEVNDSPESYSSALCTKLYIGAEYTFWNDRVGLGVLSKTNFFRRTAWEDFMLSANFRPSRWFSMTLTYNLFDGKWNNLGAGFNFNLGPVNLNLAVDNIPFKYAKCNGVAVPENTRSVTTQLGLAYVFKYKKKVHDEDGDGVPDELDLCPGTLASVAVDSTGCPLDEDKDGVPDYLDKCPGTPKEAIGTVDTLGCPMDSDGDGVPDYLDKCNDTPKEAFGHLDANGCPKDSDGDGVPDYMDKCNDTPSNVPVDANGCPLDSDGDGVLDYMDKCPDVAGTVANDGCPELKTEEVAIVQKAMKNILFESARATLRKSSYSTLNELAQLMLDNPTYKLSIVGHTDSTGNPQKNQKLSEDRAAAVKSYLVNKGVSEDRITSEGKGDTQPLVDNNTAANRATNRRVELTVSSR